MKSFPLLTFDKVPLRDLKRANMIPKVAPKYTKLITLSNTLLASEEYSKLIGIKEAKVSLPYKFLNKNNILFLKKNYFFTFSI